MATENMQRPPVSSEEIHRYQQEFNLSGQLYLLLALDEVCPLRNKTVLEVGGSNLPQPFVLDVLGARKWICVDRIYEHNRMLWPRQYEQAHILPVGSDLELEALPSFTLLDGQVENLPASFAGKFDAAVSIDSFEHILRLSTALDRMYEALRDGGRLAAIYSPIWPCHIGHHLWGVTDKAGRTYYIESSPIPPWGHLLMRPPEMHRYLLDHTDAETAAEIVYQVYHSENLNRLFVEDFEAYFRQSKFANVKLQSYVPAVQPPEDVQKKLENMHPGRRQFSQIGILACCDKA